jgi:hypothetical protein
LARLALARCFGYVRRHGSRVREVPLQCLLGNTAARRSNFRIYDALRSEKTDRFWRNADIRPTDEGLPDTTRGVVLF